MYIVNAAVYPNICQMICVTTAGTAAKVDNIWDSSVITISGYIKQQKQQS